MFGARMLAVGGGGAGETANRGVWGKAERYGRTTLTASQLGDRVFSVPSRLEYTLQQHTLPD